MNMLIKIVCMVLSLACVSCGAGGKWTRQDTYRHAALTTLMSVDYLQTMKIARNPDDYHEHNPILGKHPSEEEVTTYFISAYLLTTAAAIALPEPYREYFQYGVIGIEGVAVGNNLSIGLGFGF